MHKSILRISLLVALCFAFACKQKIAVNPEITKEELYQHIDFLASDSLMGRQPGTPYDRVAAKYIKDKMALSGIKLMEKNGYQFLEFIEHQDVGESNTLAVNGIRFGFGDDFTVLPFSSSDTLVSTAVFVGYGLNFFSDTLTWDDYATVNVSEKWAIMLRGNPFGDNPNSPLATHTSDRYKAMRAKDQGAAGVILVSGEQFDRQDHITFSRQKSFNIDIPVVHIKRSVANAILKPSGKNVGDLEADLMLKKHPSSFAVGASICARTDIVTSKRNTQNVVGLIKGTDPLLKNQYIVVGAHFDHIGMGGKSSSSRMPDSLAVHSGADDNASGVAAVLEIGQRLAHQATRRSVVVVAFAAEEMGLLGSRYFVENLPVPRDSIVTMINIDMLGRLNEESTLQVGGVKTSAEAENLLLSTNEGYSFNLALSPQGYGPSDHASFYAQNIPVLFFSTGPHTDYHTPNDRIQRINFDGLQRASNFIFDVVTEIANAPQALTFQEAGPAQPSSRHGQELKVRLGIMPDVSGAPAEGLRVLAVTEDQPAWVAGIQKNDMITAINGKPVRNIQDYMFRLQDLTAGSTISVELKRRGKTMVVLVQL